MAGPSKIEWTEATWNPVVGCSIVSPGCTNCYAMRMAYRIRAASEVKDGASHYCGTVKLHSNGMPIWTGKLALAPEHILTEPLRRRKPTTYFVNSMGDLFHEDVPDEWIDRVFAVMALCPQHRFQILTKRAERMKAYFAETWQPAPARSVTLGGETISVPAETRPSDRWDQINHAIDELSESKLFDADRFWTPEGSLIGRPDRGPLPNVWLGVSAERQKEADERIPLLLETPAAIRFVSCEPLLGPIRLQSYLPRRSDPGAVAEHSIAHRLVTLDWVIVGGESGPGARPMHPDWARSLRDQCLAAQGAGSADGATGIRRPAFFFKQWGAWGVDDGPARDGRDPIMDGKASCAWWNGQGWTVAESGHVVDLDEAKASGEWVYRLGKKAAGRLLDGREWNDMPGATP